MGKGFGSVEGAAVASVAAAVASVAVVAGAEELPEQAAIDMARTMERRRLIAFFMDLPAFFLFFITVFCEELQKKKTAA